MNSARWEEIKALLGEVLLRPVEEQDRFLAEFPADAALKAEVTRLLRNGTDQQEFLEPPPKAVIDPPLRMISMAFAGCAIGDYELVEDIGRGASGTVYRAKQVSLGRPAAVKILAHHLCASEHARERFKREAEAASKLRHEAIVSIFSFGEQSGAFYIAMELVTGDSLRDLIAACAARKAGIVESDLHGRLDVSDPAVAACLVEKLARGLQHCHENHVIHRDVKPANIVVDEKKQPRLIDFGLAKDGALRGLTEPGMLAGTPHYMSPEQARSLGAPVDQRTDIYSLGVVLYELLALERPFERTKPGDLFHAIGHNDPRHVALVNPDVPPELAAVCMKALARRPEDRYSTAAAMAEDLQLFMSGRRTRAPKYSSLRRVREVLLSHRGEVAAGCLLLGVGVFAALRDSQVGAVGPSRRMDQPRATAHELKETFEQSIEGMPEEEQLKQRNSFNDYLLQRIIDNSENKAK